jgi:hypothetical protein
MSSTISNYIELLDTTFPVPGVDNDTQGFRDNYGVIAGGLSALGNEITDLQSSATVFHQQLSSVMSYTTTYPTSQNGAEGDMQGTIGSTVTNNIATMYICTANYTDGTQPIWIKFTATNIVF